LAQAENFPAEQFGKQRDELAREIEKKIRNREAARASAIREYAAAFEKQVRPPIEQRTYRQAAAALDTLAKQPKLRPAAQRIERDSKDIARLTAFWQEVEKQAAGLEAGVAITIDGKRVVFDEYKDGKIFYKHSAVRLGDALVELGAPDIVGLFGSEFPENETQMLQAAAFLLFDKKPDRAAARRILLKAKPGDDAERYMALALAPGELEADEKAGREVLGTLGKTIAAGSTRMKAALARFLEDFGHTRFYNDHLATIEKLRSGEKDEPAEKPPLPDLASETTKTLRAHWGMDGIRDKRVRDKTGRGNDARPHDNVRFEEGIMGGCADLERGYLEIPYNMALVRKGSFSIDFCMKAKSLFKYSAGPPVISLGADKSGSIRKGAGGAFSLRVRNDGLALDFRPVAAGNDRDDTPAVHPIAGRKWYHVALVVDSAKREATMYVGGKQARTIKMSAGFNNTQRHPLVIGGESAKRYQGVIDEVHLWLCPLSAEQVITLAKHWGLGPEGEQAEIREKRKARIDMHNARLGKTTSWKNIGLPLQHAIASLLSKIEVPYQWDRSAKEIGDLAHKGIKANFTDIPAGEALRRALAPLKLVYEVDEEGVFLRPQ
ncbi:MAG: LamG domain-containing protein, partial [Planctomycetes bacterium]|nr:LamG domain-containing protein [Planctomycetota bacterium]